MNLYKITTQYITHRMTHYDVHENVIVLAHGFIDAVHVAYQMYDIKDYEILKIEIL